MREKVIQSKRIVVKAGTSILTSQTGLFSRRHFNGLCREVLSVRTSGREAVLVSSGAIGFGMEVRGFKRRPRKMAQLQACAAIGQGKLMHAYEQFFARHGIHTAQVLLTREGIERRERFLAACHTLNELLRMKVLPVVNENDTVSTEEIGFGDNDTLSVHTAHLVHADLVILLSDVDGFFLKDGSRVRVVTTKRELEEELPAHVNDRYKEKTVGGMRAKLQAAGTAMRLGIPLLMVNGHKKGALASALAGEDTGTLFLPSKKKRKSREMWISFSAPRRGTVVVDTGACEALCRRKVSLLPSGIIKVRGQFDKGEVVELEDTAGSVFGRGVVHYSSRDLNRLAGKKTGEIHEILGYKYQDEIIHRNDMVIWD